MIVPSGISPAGGNSSPVALNAAPLRWDPAQATCSEPSPVCQVQLFTCTPTKWDILLLSCFTQMERDSLRVVYFRYSISGLFRGVFLQWVFPTSLPHSPFTSPRSLENVWSAQWLQVTILVLAWGHRQVVAPQFRYGIPSLIKLWECLKDSCKPSSEFCRFSEPAWDVWRHPKENRQRRFALCYTIPHWAHSWVKEQQTCASLKARVE